MNVTNLAVDREIVPKLKYIADKYGMSLRDYVTCVLRGLSDSESGRGCPVSNGVSFALREPDRAPVIRIHLSEQDQYRLELAFATTPDRKFHDRLQIVRLAHRNRPHQDIATDLGVTPRTVQRWLNAYLERGLDGLEPRKSLGAGMIGHFY